MENTLEIRNINNTERGLKIKPALPWLPAVPKRQKLQHRSNSTLSSEEIENSASSVVLLQSNYDGLLQAHRTQQQRDKNPHRLHLDRRGLSAIPDLVNEQRLRFLSLQHNLITNLENFNLFVNQLVFLDLYDNLLEAINGIENLTNLKVLLLGKNKLRSMDGLNKLLKLEVLDLHGNQIMKIEQLETLKDLKVLNIAGNLIRVLGSGDFKNLNALQELNLRRNKIRHIYSFDDPLKITKLYLSNNDIDSLDDLGNVLKLITLKEISIDGNPVSLSTDCVSFLVSHLPQLEILSNMQITDQVRKAAVTWRLNTYGTIVSMNNIRKEHNDITEYSDLDKISNSEKNLIDSKKLPVLINSINIDDKTGNSISANDFDEHNYLFDSNYNTIQSTNFKYKTTSKMKEQDGDYLIEINGRVLNIYGQGALRFIDRPWNPIKAGDVITIKFTYVNFITIASILSKIKCRFPNADHFHFINTNIYCLGQLNALSDIQGFSSLTINSEGNSIVEKDWRKFAIYRLWHWGLRVINNIEVTQSEINSCEETFKGLTEIVLTCLPDNLLEPLLERLQLIQNKTNPRDWLKSADAAVRSVVAKEALQWKRNKPEDFMIKQKAKHHLCAIAELTVTAVIKLKRLNEEWPNILHELILETLKDYSDMNQYKKQSLKNILQ